MAVWNLVIVALTASGNAVGDFAPLFAIRPGMSVTEVELLLKDNNRQRGRDVPILQSGPNVSTTGTYLYNRLGRRPVGVVVVYGRDGRVVSSKLVLPPVNTREFQSAAQWPWRPARR